MALLYGYKCEVSAFLLLSSTPLILPLYNSSEYHVPQLPPPPLGSWFPMTIQGIGRNQTMELCTNPLHTFTCPLLFNFAS